MISRILKLTILAVFVLNIAIDSYARPRRSVRQNNAIYERESSSSKVDTNFSNTQTEVPEFQETIEFVGEEEGDVSFEEFEEDLTMSPEELGPMSLLDTKHKLDIGDRVELTIIEDRSEPYALYVNELGYLNVPLVGLVRAEGYNCQQIGIKIKRLLEEDYYKKATPMVSIQRDSRIGAVHVFGETVMQGSIEIPPNEVFTISRAIALAGGFTSKANSTVVKVFRNNINNSEERQSFTVNVYDILKYGQVEKDMVLMPGDRIVIPSKGATVGKVKVTGAVRSPGAYSIPIDGDITVGDIILQAGGFTTFANKTVKVNRLDPKTGQETIIKVDVEDVLENGSRSKDLVLQENDIVVVSEKWFNF